MTSARSLLLMVAPALALAACAGPGGGRFGEGPRLRPVANPGQVVATELSFARAAQEKGQWTAFIEYAADGAVMFAPGPVDAKEFLKGRANPAKAVAWEPHRVWSSCDGSLAVTTGGWTRPDGSVGWFATVWQRQEDGSYRWTMDDGAVLDEPLRAPEMVAASVATCDPRPMVSAVDPAADGPGGAARDRTLSWTMRLAPDNSRVFSVTMWNGMEGEEVLRLEAPAG